MKPFCMDVCPSSSTIPKLEDQLQEGVFDFYLQKSFWFLFLKIVLENNF